MSNTLDDFKSRIPEKFRDNLSLLEGFSGNRTLVSFLFKCGCKTEQSLKAILKLKRFDFCHKHAKEYDVEHSQKYTCTFCCKEFINKNMHEKCEDDCKSKWQNLNLNEDYVKCVICGFHAKSLGNHLNKKHNLSPKDYRKQYNVMVISYKSSEAYSNQNGINGNYVNKCKDNGVDLTEYWEKVSLGVKNAISNNPNEITRRSKLMSKINKTDEMRQKASETAKKTSARPEIQKARSSQLAKWREENPEDFYEKCVKKMITAFQSKPEKYLFEFVKDIYGFNFKKNQFVNSIFITNKSHNKQVDIADKEKRIYIEYDGVLHFLPKYGNDTLQNIRDRDFQLDQHISNHNWTLIRVSFDQFLYRSKMVDKIKQDNSYFKQECLDEIIQILNSGITGIYKIGDAYGKYSKS